ncbi:MAG: FHA domain-containing protein [Solirubrobacteraceae bacterium]
MTATCPRGHASATTDYCDQCGAPVIDEVDTSTTARREPCPACCAPRSGDDRFCEGCGHDFLSPTPPPPVSPAAAAWEAVAGADRRHYERYATAEVAFPDAYPERRFRLTEAAVRIGRSSGRPGEAVPEIDLAGTPEDPAISRVHAVLERGPDGSYALRDLDSTNGTTVNDDPAQIAAGAAVAVGDGDRIHLGAWTTITVRGG